MDRYLTDALTAGDIAMGRYSYVSLFGVDSLDEFKYSIFENSVRTADIGVGLTIDALRSNTTAAAELFIRKSLRVVQQTPIAGNYIGGLSRVWFSSVKETIVCVDDIERRGDNLSARDVLGLVSTLKEQKKCKVALILNDEALDTDKAEFLKYYEKVVDISLKFAPSATECSQIALGGSTTPEKLLSQNCVMLGISNIRLIKRIERSVREVEGMLAKFEKGVLKQAIHSLALLGWSIYEPSVAPSLEYLQKRGSGRFRLERGEALPPKEAAWNALLDAYGFAALDEFDLVLLDGVRNGLFDPRQVETRAADLDSKIRAAQLDDSFSEAWDLYHGSFDDNQAEVLGAIYRSALSGIQQITPLNLNGTVTLLKEFGRLDEAAQLIEHYVARRSNERKIFDLRNYPFGSEVTDPDVIEAFTRTFARTKTDRDLAGC